MPGEDPKARLLEAAARVLIRDGLTGLTTRRLAREAGVNHGLVHYHFGSLDAVVGELMDAVGRHWVASLARAAGAPGGFLDRWRALREAQDREVASGESKLRAELAIAAANDPDLRDRWRAVVDARFELLSIVVSGMLHEYRLSPSLVLPVTSLVGALLDGLELNARAGIDLGQPELDHWIEGWILGLAEGDAAEPGVPPG